MNETPEDSDKGGTDQRFSPTDWDWIMLLSGEINAIKTRSDTVSNTVMGVLMACAGFVVAAIIFQIPYLGFSDSTLDGNSSAIHAIVIVIFCFLCYILWSYKREKRETEDRVKPLEECRNGLFGRLDDPNKIHERCFKKGDKNKGALSYCQMLQKIIKTRFKQVVNKISVHLWLKTFISHRLHR